ncbi:conserved exported hypothetical protein [metagenome]|uniref:Uncharacterized protein n=1 Tax=metagenome TaxID=256318 RepID=A0A2P2C8A9_9ZZZZ
MTPSTSPSRLVSRAVALAVVVSLPLVSTPAFADVPEGWRSEPAPINGLHALLLLAGIPLVLFVGITLLVMAPSLARGEVSGEMPDEWFGGPGQGTKALPAADDSTETGGASGRW